MRPGFGNCHAIHQMNAASEPTLRARQQLSAHPSPGWAAADSSVVYASPPCAIGWSPGDHSMPDLLGTVGSLFPAALSLRQVLSVTTPPRRWTRNHLALITVDDGQRLQCKQRRSTMGPRSRIPAAVRPPEHEPHAAGQPTVRLARRRRWRRALARLPLKPFGLPAGSSRHFSCWPLPTATTIAAPQCGRCSKWAPCPGMHPRPSRADRSDERGCLHCRQCRAGGTGQLAHTDRSAAT